MEYHQALEIAEREGRTVEEVQREAQAHELAETIAPKQTTAVQRARAQAEAAAAKADEEEARLRRLAEQWASLVKQRPDLAAQIDRAKYMVAQCEGTIKTQQTAIKDQAGRTQHFEEMLFQKLNWLASAQAGLPVLKEALCDLEKSAASLEEQIVRFAKANGLEHLLK